MNIGNAWSAWKGLDRQQKEFLREKQEEATLRLDEWIPHLAKIVKFDREADSIRKFLGWTGGLCLPAGIAIAIFAESAIPLVICIFGLGLLVSLWRLSKIDVPNGLNSFLLPFLVLLREETKPDAAVTLKLDLRGFDADDKLLSKNGPSSLVTSLYKDSWFSGSTLLADGASLEWDITDLVRQRRRRKTNARGKTKTKTKTKARRTFDIHLNVRGKDYAIKANPPELDDEIRQKIKQGEKRSEIRIRTQSVSTDPTVAPDVDELVEAIASAYRNLTAPAEERPTA